MNGVHDMGGMHGFGRVQWNAGEPVFHEEWERRAFGLNQVIRLHGYWTTDEQRHATERMAPAHYLSAPYYERTLAALATLLVEKGLLSREEIEARVEEWSRKAGAGEPLPRREDPRLVERVEEFVRRGRPSRLSEARPPRFTAGSRVRARNIHPCGHTRLPRYARGKAGTVEEVRGVFRLPDAVVEGRADVSEHVYAVRFEARELWGEAAASGEAVYLDLWESYLTPA